MSNMNTLSPSHPGMTGAAISLSSAVIAFFEHSMVIIQWSAGVLAAVAALASIASVIRHWDK